jgi:hypothetical protein
MEIILHLISGMSLGIEYVSPEATEDGSKCVVIDLFILRVMCFWQ